MIRVKVSSAKSSAARKGFCTKACNNPGGLCGGGPAGSLAHCVLASADGSQLFCAFHCTLDSFPYRCPSEMTCGDETPPGSGQRPCVP